MSILSSSKRLDSVDSQFSTIRREFMTCAVLQRDRHEGEVRTAGAPGEHPMTGRYQLQPTVFVDAVPELAAERRRNRD